MDEKTYKQLAMVAQRLKTEKDQAKGRLDAALAELADRYQVDSIRAALTLLGQLEREAAMAREEAKAALDKLTADWGHLLDE